MSRPGPDPVARWIAQIVAHHLVSSPAERPGLPPLPEGITAVEAHPVGELAVGVVATMGDGAVRYFLVWVAEFTTR